MVPRCPASLSPVVSYEVSVSGSPFEQVDFLVLSWYNDLADAGGLTCRRETTGFRDRRSFREVVDARTVVLEPASVVEQEAVELVRSNGLLSPKIMWSLFWSAFVVPALDGEDGGWLASTFPREAPGWLRAELEIREQAARKVLES